MESSEKITEIVKAHVVISGRVQGVCFRMFTEEEAKRLGLTGWVRNLPSGKVEAVFEGKKEEVDAMISWCHKGPPAAKVKEVAVIWEEADGKFSSFKVTSSW